MFCLVGENIAEAPVGGKAPRAEFILRYSEIEVSCGAGTGSFPGKAVVYSRNRAAPELVGIGQTDSVEAAPVHTRAVGRRGEDRGDVEGHALLAGENRRGYVVQEPDGTEGQLDLALPGVPVKLDRIDDREVSGGQDAKVVAQGEKHLHVLLDIRVADEGHVEHVVGRRRHGYTPACGSVDVDFGQAGGCQKCQKCGENQVNKNVMMHYKNVSLINF